MFDPSAEGLGCSATWGGRMAAMVECAISFSSAGAKELLQGLVAVGGGCRTVLFEERSEQS